jgi:glycosyltransferase involved in cell wall biosynthesis
MKISVVVPVRNEQDSIRALLNTLLAQTLIPDEIIITDGGSTDATPDIISKYIADGAPLILISAGPSLPGRGRNIGAARASSEWLAFIDAGIRPEPNWLSSLAEAARREKADVVYGAWEPSVDNLFKECAAIAYVPPPVKTAGFWMRPRFIASSLMRRAVWESVGGFPEELRSGEDLLFMNKIEGSAFRITNAPEAVVCWSLQPTWWRTFKRFVIYARYNIRAGLWRQWQLAIFKRYGLLLLFTLPALIFGGWWIVLTVTLWLLLLIARSIKAIWKNRDCQPATVSHNLVRLLVLVPLISVLDAATFVGSIQWFLEDKVRLLVSTRPDDEA